MEQQPWPTLLLIVGFSVTAVCLLITMINDFSGTTEIVLSIVQILGIVVGSMGLGASIAMSKRS